MFEIGLQICVAVLLAVTIAYAVVLNRKLNRLRDGSEEMRTLTAELTAAMANAERSVAALRNTALEDDKALGRRVTEARAVRDEVAFLLDRAETLSTRLEAPERSSAET